MIDNNKNKIEKTIKNNKISDEEHKKHEEYINKLLDKVNQEYKDNTSSDNNYKYIDDLVDSLEANISEDLLKSNLSLKNNIYVIDHDYLGNKLEKEVLISEKENKILYKSNHQFFNTDVLYYTSYKNNKIEVFYDSITKILLGYKEENKNFTMNVKTDKKIKINYSIKNKLKLLGHKYQYYNIAKEEGEEDNQDMIKDIIRERNDLLKNTIYRFQRVLFRIVNNFFIKKNVKEQQYNQYNKDAPKINEELDYFTNKYENLVEKYGKKLSNLSLVSQSGSHLVFKHWKNLADNLNIKVKDIDNNTNIINYEKINKFDHSNNLLLFYFINELNKLYKYNTNKTVKINITSMIIEYINLNYFVYNEDITKNDKDFKRFWYIINSQLYLDEIKDKVGETEGIYEEAVDPDKKALTDEEQSALDDAKEEDDALDVEGNELDYEAGYERNLERSFDDGFVENYPYKN